MKYFSPFLFLCFLLCSKVNALDMEISDYNKMLSYLNLRESIPIVYVFDQANNASHYHIVETKQDEYLIVTKDLVKSWIEGDKKFKEDLTLDTIVQYTNSSKTKKAIASLQESKAKYKLVFFNAWFEILNQYPELVAYKKKRLELFSSISSEDNDIQVIEIELQDKMNEMKSY